MLGPCGCVKCAQLGCDCDDIRSFNPNWSSTGGTCMLQHHANYIPGVAYTDSNSVHVLLADFHIAKDATVSPCQCCSVVHSKHVECSSTMSVVNMCVPCDTSNCCTLRLFGHWRQVALSFGFEEYDAPVLENEALYVRKSGEEVTQQLFNFEDKGGRRVILQYRMLS